MRRWIREVLGETSGKKWEDDGMRNYRKLRHWRRGQRSDAKKHDLMKTGQNGCKKRHTDAKRTVTTAQVKNIWEHTSASEIMRQKNMYTVAKVRNKTTEYITNTEQMKKNYDTMQRKVEDTQTR